MSNLRIILHKHFNLSDREWLWYQELERRHPHIGTYLDQCAVIDSDGKIVEFVAVENMPLEILYFLMVVSINQRLRLLDAKLK